MTYHEAWELSYFGANVLHPRTTLPAMKYRIPISIRNFFNLVSPGEGCVGMSEPQPGQSEHEVHSVTYFHLVRGGCAEFG